MCLQNLLRRKSRSLLTVLGVVIGCCAIVIMVSLGFGTQEAQDQMLSQMGDLTKIEVYNYGSGSDLKFDEATINSFRQINGVAAVAPKLELGNYYSCQAFTGANRRFQCYWVNLIGGDMETANEMGYQLVAGRMPEKTDEVLAGEYFAYEFMDSMRPENQNWVNRYEGGWDEEGNLINVPDPFFDPVGATITLEFTLSNGNPYKVDLKVVGVLKENWDQGAETSYGMMMDASALRSIISQVMVQDGVKREITYNQVLVKAKDIDSVAQVQKEIDTYGFDTWSMESIREPLQQEARQKQLMLGGLGAISLLVAAIGIANTMVMAISERTREIGIMKSLGCRLRDIRTMFLLEAGMIGLIGGLIGSIISIVAMVTINIISFGSGFNWQNVLLCFTGSDAFARTSVIPLWLLLFAVVFSILIGLISGYYPANKAVKVSALEAIRSGQ